jgi:hypothetical protein
MDREAMLTDANHGTLGSRQLVIKAASVFIELQVLHTSCLVTISNNTEIKSFKTANWKALLPEQQLPLQPQGTGFRNIQTPSHDAII